ncbi:MAG: hypothetical protein AB1352_04615 [Patescibacteria group bacterium]
MILDSWYYQVAGELPRYMLRWITIHIDGKAEENLRYRTIVSSFPFASGPLSQEPLLFPAVVAETL